MISSERRKGIEYKLGPLGQCVCPNCGKTKQPSARQPCYSMKCPECGSRMTKRK